MHDADAGRHDLEGVEGLLAPLEELVALACCAQTRARGFDSAPAACRRNRPAPSGPRRDRPARAARPSSGFTELLHGERMAARSTSSGTPVKSCSTMRATVKGISYSPGAFAFQLARFLTSASVTFLPSNCAAGTPARCGWKPAASRLCRCQPVRERGESKTCRRSRCQW
jgi:hypothetical protein